jgi:signal transduction histidine kinase
MVRRWAIEAVAVGVAASVATAIALTDRRPLIDWVFMTVMFWSLVQVGRLTVRSWLHARAERGRAERLQAMEPSEVARAAVEEERRRLHEEIARSLHDVLGRILRDLPEETSSDPRPALRRVHQHTRWATSELRRQLGLLRGGEAEPPPQQGTAEDPQVTWPLRDRLLGAAVSVLAVTESLVYLPIERPGGWSAASVVLAGAAGATIAGWRVAPAWSAVACAATYGVAVLLGTFVPGGFWFVATFGVLLWRLTVVLERERLVRAATAALLVSVLGETWLLDRDNVEISTYVAVVVLVAGSLVRRSRRHRADESARADARRQALDVTTRRAVRDERTGFARELHDVVSHAIGLIAMQAGAAEVSWPQDRAATARAVELVRQTALRTIGEVERLVPAGSDTADVGPDLDELVSRLSATGTRVDLRVSGAVPREAAALVHRVVQEGLTNAVRHAPGAAVTVVVVTEEEGVSVEVRDAGSDLPRSPTPRGGHGLVGLSERLELAGGSLRAEPVGSGFCLRADIPLSTREGAR